MAVPHSRRDTLALPISVYNASLKWHFLQDIPWQKCVWWVRCLAEELLVSGCDQLEKLYLALPLMSTIIQLHICLSLLNWQKKNLEVQESQSCQHDNTSTSRQKMWTMMTRIWMFQTLQGTQKLHAIKNTGQPYKVCTWKPILLLCSLWRQSWRCLFPAKNMLGNGKNYQLISTSCVLFNICSTVVKI